MSLVRTLPVLALLVALYLLHLFSRQNLSITYDEPSHLMYGFRVASGNSERFDNSKMPVSAFNALPLKLSGLNEEHLLNTSDPAALVNRAREMTVWAGLLLGLVVFCWAAELYGYPAGLFALALYVFEPNLTAHSQLVTTDLYAALFITLALYAFWRFLARPGWGRLTASAVALGLAQVAKYSAAYLYPVFLAIALVWLWRQPSPRALWRRFCGAIAVYLVASVVVINAAFLFNHSFEPWGGFAFKSHFFQDLQKDTSAFAKVPVPLPFPYLEGLDHVKYGDERGAGLAYGKIFLLGETKDHGQFAGYYLVAFLFKTPLGLQLLLLWALVHYCRRRANYQFLRDELFLAAPALFFVVYFNFLFNSQIGIRYFLVVYPLAIVFTASLLRDWPGLPRRPRLAGAVLTAWMAVSSLSYFGHYLSYFNELVGDRKNSYRILADSNLDWGQNTNYLSDYLKAHPDTVYNPPEPSPGRFIIDANLLDGVIPHIDQSWLHHFRPTGHLVYSYLIFDISADDLKKFLPR